MSEVSPDAPDAAAPSAAPPRFVHLHLHSEYSLVDGLLRIDDIVDAACRFGMPAVALTDQGNLFGLVRFFTRALSRGIKPIAGAELCLEGQADDATDRVIALVQNRVGYRHLTELVSKSYLEDRHGGLPTVSRRWLDAHHEGLLWIMPMLTSPVTRALRRDPEAARAELDGWLARSPGRVYLEITRTGRPGEAGLEAGILDLAIAAQVPPVASQDVRFLEQDDFEAHETRVCIHQGRGLNDPSRPRAYADTQYFCDQDSMAERFSDLPAALANSLGIAERCSLDLELGTYHLPDYPVPDGETMEQYFRRLAHEGLEERFAERVRAGQPQPDEATRAQYVDRLAFEIGIILQMGYPGYFLIVMEFINWAKSNGVPVGPGRGSGAGSLVAYALRITDIDPIVYDLLFERFLNPERVSMPDFDVDFCMDGRDRVIAHVADRYGQDAVSQIVTFGTMAAKAVVRDVARVQGKPFGLADRLSKLIPFEVGMTLDKAMKQEPDLAAFVAADEDAAEIMDMAFRLEGIVRNMGKHAGGVVIAPSALTNYVPICADDSGGGLMTQFDKDDVEQAGLVKFDFLGLRTLTIIDWALAEVNRQRRSAGEADLLIEQLPLDDQGVFRVLSSGETTAVFQLESRGMKELIRRLKPDCFEDIIALVALFRPGPLQSGMADEFIKRKHGEARVAYPVTENHFDELAPVLKTTYGVILYQEQVMQIAQVLAGFSLGGADLLRRAMGKKKASEMAKQRSIFLAGAVERGVPEGRANDLFDLMEKFAGYGFNKSHSAAYALVSYQTAWLKLHHPAAFMAAVLSADMLNTDKVVTLVEECRRLGLTVFPPDVNASFHRFAVADERTILWGLGAIKGVGEGAVADLVAARQDGGAFTDLFDFCRRVDGKRAGSRVLEALIRCGAMDALTANGDPGGRAALLAGVDLAVREAERLASNAAAGIEDLFGGEAEDIAPAVGLPTVPAMPEKERLALEKAALGMYVSGHPIAAYELELEQMPVTRVRDLRAGDQKRHVAGLIMSVRMARTRKGEMLATAVLDDRTGRMEISLFGEVLERCREHLVVDRVVLAEGRVEDDDFTGGYRARLTELQPLEVARERFAQALVIPAGAQALDAQGCRELAAILAPFRGAGCPVAVDYDAGSARGRLQFGADWRVKPLDDLLESLRTRFPSTYVAYSVDVVH